MEQFLLDVTHVDHTILLFIQHYLRFPVLDTVMKFLSFLGEAGWFWIVLTLGLIIFPKTRRAGIASAVSMGLLFLVCILGLKPFVGRVRPYIDYSDLIPLGTIPKDYSFPSGHTAISFGCALVLQRMLPNKISVPLTILAALIALSRLYNCVHYPTDVLCGFIIAFIVSQAVCFVTLRTKKSSYAAGKKKKK
jgi:undecaprenyl-diphosphatase